MNILEEVAQLKAQAVELLLAERERIDAELAIFGQQKNPNAKRRGRPPRDTTSTSDRLDTIPPTSI
jgi:hypothetical protein